MSSPTLHTFRDQQEWIDAAVAEIIKDLPPDGSFAIALSGGSTPAPIYQNLARQKLPWKNADIFQVDERFLQPNKPDSNRLLIKRNFEKYLSESGKMHYFEVTGKITWEESAEQYDRLLRKYNRPFDVCILGIGSDGHTASLFPREPAVYEEERLATTSETNRFAVWKRLTITFPVILKSAKIIVLLKGEDKKETLEEFLHGKKLWEEFPAKKLLEHRNVQIFFYTIEILHQQWDSFFSQKPA